MTTHLIAWILQGIRRFFRWIFACFWIGFFGGCIVFPIMIARLPVAKECITDGIVIFTGEIEREKIARTLYQKGLAPKLHISGRYKGFHSSEVPSNISFDCASTTVQNVQMSHQWIQKNNLQSVRLVTSDYHMPRCILLAKGSWKGVVIVPHPVHPKQDRRHPMLNLFAEYLRYLAALVQVCIHPANDKAL